MSPKDYHEIDAPESPADDSDTDLDLDLQELDPVTSTHASSARRGKSQSERRGGLIPLRNLRMGGLRGTGQRHGGFVESGCCIGFERQSIGWPDPSLSRAQLHN